jgi:hypothetical protein
VLLSHIRRFATYLALLLSAGAAGAAFAYRAQIEEWRSGVNWLEPPIVTPGDAARPPSDAIVLFDGTDMSAWHGGESWIIENGSAITNGGDVVTKQHFGDCQLHVEFATPSEVSGEGQGRGNSGVFLLDVLEVQVLDSHENTTYHDGQCGALYKQRPPLVNACRGPGEWQSYDIIFHAPQFRPDGALRRPATITVLHNGVLVQDHLELLGATEYHRPPAYHSTATEGPIRLQFHGNTVKYRNIWVRRLAPPAF